ncbi:5-hydroxytryptamine receptor 2A-like isoform X2 [Tetranychus urticae]|uniref:5-hydroxytryptamine receptor 2A-like isoform X2 n=1 Tax=Tetranychus urticae TaxID=32264 RepID=UPI00077BA0EA|nr:5-hydroxytryptamine receptor 2A-like isoform X2 [Tetranychus urticae]
MWQVRYWPFGTLTCNFWVTCDVLCCSSSIYHMCFISVGRYVGIKNPLHARQARLLVSRRAVLFKIVLVWLIAALITSPITILGIADSSNIMPESAVCSISNKYFLIIGAFSAFYLPMIIMVNSYVLTVRLLRRKAKFCKNSGEHGKWPPSARSSINRKSHENQGDNGKYSGSSGNQNYCKKDFDTGKCKNTFTSKTRSLHSISDGADDFQRKTNHNHLGGKRLSSTGSLLRGHFGTEIRSRISKHYNTQPMMIRTLGSSVQVRTEQKATQVLGLVFFLFIICWSPFFTRNLIEAIFTDIQMPNSLPTIFLWLGYFSSTINPVIYTIFNRNFRRAFRRILLCQTIKYRLQRSSQSFNPNQRFGGRRGIYRYSNQNSPNNNNNSKHNDNNRSNSLNNSNNNVSNNSNRNVNSNNVLHNKLGSNNSENGRFYEDNVDLNNINLNLESNTDNVIDDDNNYHIHGYIYSKSGRLMDNMKSMKSIGSNGVEYSDDDEDGGDLDEDNDNDYLGSNEDDSTTFGSKICCTIKNKQLSDQVNAKYNSRSDECDNYRDKALNMRYYWKYSKADLKAKSEPVATIKCCSEV